MRVLISLIIIASCAATCVAQKPEFSCSMFSLKLRSSNPASIERQELNEFGHFDIEGTMEEEPIIRFFRVPNTRWFAVFRLFTSDESMVSKTGIGSIELELSFARNRRRNILTSPAVASAETPFKTFDVVRVRTVVLLDNHRHLVGVECKAP